MDQNFPCEEAERERKMERKVCEKDGNEKGFTLVELLTVAAVVGVLATVAIPQFQTYRISGFNAAAQSDLRNLRTSEEALFSDYGSYGSFASTGTAGQAGAATLWTAGTDFMATQTGGEEIRIMPSTNVGLGAWVVADAVTGEYVTYTIFSKHVNGDRIYGVDRDHSAIWWTAGNAASALAAGDQVAATAGTNDLSAAGWTQL